MSDTSTAATTPANPDRVLITLDTPIKRGETEIASFYLRKPKGRALYGFNLPDIIDLKIKTIYQLVPMISEPPLLDHEVEDLDPSDLHEIGGTLKSFFMLKAERVLFEAMLENLRQND
jgi:hypothetical protein